MSNYPAPAPSNDSLERPILFRLLFRKSLEMGHRHRCWNLSLGPDIQVSFITSTYNVKVMNWLGDA